MDPRICKKTAALSLRECSNSFYCRAVVMTAGAVTAYLHCSHFWFATLHEVLLADWHEVWHSPHPPVLAVFARSRDTKVLILFTWNSTFLFKITSNLFFNSLNDNTSKAICKVATGIDGSNI